MRKTVTFIFYLLILTSCDLKSYQVESRYENGNYEIIYKNLNDTIINDTKFTQKFKVKFFENGDTLRKGKYITHCFMET